MYHKRVMMRACMRSLWGDRKSIGRRNSNPASHSSPNEVSDFLRHIRRLSASRRRADALPALSLDVLTPSLPLSLSLDLPACLARFPAARLWRKDAVTRVKERPGFPSLEDSANLPAARHDRRRNRRGSGSCAGAVCCNRARPEKMIAPQLIRSFPIAHPPGFPSMSSIPMNSVVEDLQAALAQFSEIASDLKR